MIKKIIKKNKIQNQKGFTILELMITVFIFAVMTGLLLAKYGKFNQSLLLTNLAYDVALTIRTAQSYGLNVKSASATSNLFDYPYGVSFDINTQSTSFIFFSDQNSNGIRDPGDVDLSTYSLKKGSKISGVCAGADDSSCNIFVSKKLTITFKRPNPEALITNSLFIGQTSSYGKIILQSSDGTLKKVVVRSTGQIAITN